MIQWKSDCVPKTEDSLKGKTVKGLIWSGVERFSVQGIQFLVLLIIARILTPKDFGLVGMLTIFLAVSQTLIDSGFTQALIRKQERTEIDNSTVFHFNIIVSLILYIILYVVAPWVSSFYHEPQLKSLMRVLCLIVIINSFAVVQRAIYTATIDFKTQAKASFIAAIISGILGIYLALNGLGVWVLVWQQLVSAFINTLLLWTYSNWHPLLSYSWVSFKDLFSFGSKMMVSGLLNTVYINMYSLIIGKFFTAANLGYYTQAQNFTKQPSENLTGIIQRVTYPVLCTLQDDNQALQNDYRKLLRASAFIIFPIMCLLAGVSHPLVKVLIGDKWSFAADLIIPLCFSGMWYPVAAINLNLLQVKGRSDLFLRLEIIKKIIGVVILACSLPFGLLFMCYTGIVSSIISIFINTYYTGILINVGFIKQMKDLSGTIVASLVVFASAYLVTMFIANPFLQVFLGVTVGIILFAGIVFLFKFKELEYLESIIR